MVIYKGLDPSPKIMVDLKLSCGNDGFWKYEILEFVLPPQIWTSKKNPSDEILRFYTLT